jgi:alkaline phosphatase D
MSRLMALSAFSFVLNFARLSAISVRAAARIAALTLVILTASATVQAQVTLTHGPITGGVDANDAAIFTRTSDVATVAIQYSTDSGLANPTTSSSVTTSTNDDFTSTIKLTGLTPETAYYLNVLVNGVPQLTAPFPTFTTFPVAGSVRQFKFIYLTDFATQSTQPPGLFFGTFSAAAAENPKFVYIGGDFDHSGPITILGKRTMFKLLYDPTQSGLADFVNKILRGMAIVHCWDDHDSGPDNNSKTYSGWNWSYQVFREYVPMYATPAPPPAIYQSFSYGQVDFWATDMRSQRSDEYDVDGPHKSMLNANRLGPQSELAWLENGLLKSSATWKIIISSDGVTNPTVRYPDLWAGYQTEWIALKNFIKSNQIKNVVFLTNDLHFGAIDDGVASGFPEMTVGAANILIAPGSTCRASTVGKWDVGTYYNDNGPCYQYGVITVSTNPDQLLLQIKDDQGNVRVSHTVNAN